MAPAKKRLTCPRSPYPKAVRQVRQKIKMEQMTANETEWIAEKPIIGYLKQVFRLKSDAGESGFQTRCFVNGEPDTAVWRPQRPNGSKRLKQRMSNRRTMIGIRQYPIQKTPH